MFTDLQIPAGRRPLTRTEAGLSAIFLLVFGVLISIGVLVNYQPRNSAFFFFVLFWTPLLVVHELGHALMAWVVGWRVGEISIGFGPELYRKNWNGTEIRIKLIPIEGYVRPAPRSTRYGRIKMALVYAAGPAAEFLILAILIGILGVQGVFNSSHEYSAIAVKTLAIVIIVGAGFNLIPFPVGGAVSDGLGILISLVVPDEHLRDRLFSLELHDIENHLHEDKVDRASQLIDELKSRFPDNFTIAQTEALVLAAAGRPDKATIQLKQLLSQTRHQAMMIELCFQIVSVQLSTSQPPIPLVEDAIAAIRKVAHDHRLARIGSGCVLIQQGYLEQGGALLAFAFQETSGSPEDHLIMGYLALAARRMDDHSAANRFFRTFQGYRGSARLRDVILLEFNEHTG